MFIFICAGSSHIREDCFARNIAFTGRGNVLAGTRTRDRSLVDSSNLHDGEHMHTRDVKQKGDGIKELATPLFSAFSKSVIQHF